MRLVYAALADFHEIEEVKEFEKALKNGVMPSKLEVVPKEDSLKREG